MSQQDLRHIFIGGYTKSGTTFIGRAFDILKGVEARGEQDYFRIFTSNLNNMMNLYNRNLNYVNEEVYDGFGKLEPLTVRQVRMIQQTLFNTLFFNVKAAPAGCRFVVEKSPRNIFHTKEIRFTFPNAPIICVYRDPKPVFKSLMRHMRDHRSAAYADPESPERRKFFTSFAKNRWPLYHQIITEERQDLVMVRYDKAAANPASFLDFAQREVIGQKLGLKRDINTLSKEYYLASLPPEARAKSLVQTDTQKAITLSPLEEKRIEQECAIPNIDFDF